MKKNQTFSGCPSVTKKLLWGNQWSKVWLPISCRFSYRFYYCNSHEKIDYSCQGGSVFNAKTGDCEFGAACTSFDSVTGLCKSKFKQLVGHPLAKSLYVYCDTIPVLLQCISESYEFDPATFGCGFVCKTAGRFPDAEKIAAGKKTFYYECVKNGNAFNRYHMECPSNTEFVETVGRCMPTGNPVPPSD